MNLTSVLHQISAFAQSESRVVGRAIGGFAHNVADFARTAPTNVWAMCAFVAAGSIMVTLVTLVLWPAHRPSVPTREATTPAKVRALAIDGVGVPEIARRTGLSHDAVATILRAGSLPRADRTAAMRKSRPSAA